MLAKALQGAAASAVPAYVEDVFSTYLYTGTGSTQTITNGIDLAGKGGLVWFKNRSALTGAYTGFDRHVLFDNIRTGATGGGAGGGGVLRTNAAALDDETITYLSAYNNNGVTIAPNSTISNAQFINQSGTTFASWTFRRQAKFFDVVTYTGNGANRTIAHNLGSVPGCIIVKRTDTTSDWQVYHRSLANTEYTVLNTTAAKATGATRWNSTTPTSTVFSLGTDTTVNANAGTYVAYIFAHDAGGFGLTGTDNVISCGTFTTDGSGNATVNLGYEPQWLLFKKSLSAGDWKLADVMRGFNASGWNELNPNYFSAESVQSGANILIPTATGFQGNNSTFSTSSTYIYIAIRRGPMKTPTSGTSVFQSITRAGTGATATVSGVGFNPDLVMSKSNSNGYNWNQFDRLRGQYKPLFSPRDWPEDNQTTSLTGFDVQNGYTLGADSGYQEINYSGQTYYNYHFGRAPGYFDIVAYSGSGSNATQNHNLGSVPELMFVKRRNGTALSSAGDWQVYSSTLANTEYLVLNSTNAKATGATRWNSTTPTSTVFSVGTDATVNGSGNTYVAYLFSTVSGVSKVGSYTGTGALQTINCGFAAGARFVLIKRTDSTGDWYLWDSTRGISSGNDPYVLLSSPAAEATGTNYVDTDTTGFKVTAAAPAELNASGGTYIFLAIA
jgi:hypothetical protein